MYTVIASVICTALLICFFTSLYYNYKFGIMILNVQDKLEESLDILDEKYRSISIILEKPVFFDSVEVRQALSDISESRDAILYIANELVDSVLETREEDKE